MSATCPSCGCSQPDGLLCWQDSEAVMTMLAAAPELVDQLDVAASKQAKISTGGKAGKGSAHERSPVNWGAAAARDALLVELALWGGDIDAIRKHPQAAEIVSGIGRAVKNGYQAIDRMGDRKYLGTCGATIKASTPQAVDTLCYAEIWAKPGAHQVKCSVCGYVHEVGGRRALLLEMAADMLFSVKDAATMMGDVGGIRVTQASIRGYLHRKRIAYRPGGTMIRLGDLLAVVLDESERKAS